VFPVQNSRAATSSTEAFDSLIQVSKKPSEVMRCDAMRCQNDSFDGIDTSSRLILAIGKTLIVVRQILNWTRDKEGLTLPAI
jgi:hypothetical protein